MSAFRLEFELYCTLKTEDTRHEDTRVFKFQVKFATDPDPQVRCPSRGRGEAEVSTIHSHEGCRCTARTATAVAAAKNPRYPSRCERSELAAGAVMVDPERDAKFYLVSFFLSFLLVSFHWAYALVAIVTSCILYGTTQNMPMTLRFSIYESTRSFILNSTTLQ